jgi:hypothetical protein
MWEDPMRFCVSTKDLLWGAALASFCAGAALMPVLAADTSIPNLMAANYAYGWTSMGGEWTMLPDSGQTTVQDPNVKYVPNNVAEQPTFRYANANNPNLMQWASDELKKDNARQDRGFAMWSRSARCWAQGVPVFLINPARPTYFIQTPKEVLMISETDHQVRHVYLNVPHSANPKPSWYGESVGRYEGNELVIDTIGQNTKTFIDNFRTPHGQKLHVVERFRIIEGGKTLEEEITVEDPDTLIKPWHFTHRHRRVDQPMQESSCAESGGDHFPVDAEPIPESKTNAF